MSINVPFITLNRFEKGFKEEFLNGVEKLFDNTQFVGGPIVSEFETNLSRFVKSDHALGCANGTDAIQIALRACGVSSGDNVLIPDMTFWATFESVVNVGATPITVDVNRNDWHWDADTFKLAVEKFKPKAAILVHLYGWAAKDTLAIRSIAHESGVILIEDGAQCFGTEISGKSILGSAQIATTSFYPAKVLGASGDAGAIFTNDSELAKTCRQLINHGRTDHYSHGLVGWNSRLGAYEALFLNISLKHIEKRIESRKKSVDYYTQNLSNLNLIIKSPASDVKENGYCQVSQLEASVRTSLIEYLKSKSIGFGTIYPGAMSLQPGAKAYLKDKIDYGNAHNISQTVLNLPCFAYMTEQELEYVVRHIKAFFN